MTSRLGSWSTCVLVILAILNWSNGQNLCSVFQPYKVTPEKAKFQIGGPFPLHTEDCIHARPDVVQELIGVQWALTQWNQKPANANFKLALSAFDTCSRGRESLSQTMTFLHESGFFSPHECRNTDHVPLGLILPTLQDGRLNWLTEGLISAQVPVITSSGAVAQALFDANMPTVFSTAPTLDHMMQATIGLLKSLHSDVISMIYSDQHITRATLEKQLASLSSAHISTFRSIPITDSKSINTNSTEIVIMIASKDELIDFFMTTQDMATDNLKKLFIIIPALGEDWIETEIAEFLLPMDNISYRLIIIQQASIFNGTEFRDYFLDILKNNYENYALLATYIQQVYNCTLTGFSGMVDCSKVTMESMIKGFTPNRRVESAILAAYIYGSIAKYVNDDREKTCLSANPECTGKILSYLKDRMVYTFSDLDPNSYHGFTLKFAPDRVLYALPIEGIYITRESKIQIDTIFNFQTGSKIDPARIRSDLILWSDGNPIKTQCDQWRPECQNCPDSQKYTPRSGLAWVQKPSNLFLLGLFDIRRGLIDRSIDDPRNILTPAAFSYILDRIGPGASLEIGGIVLDTCTDGISALETIVAVGSGQCLVINGSGLAPITIPSKNIVGLISGQGRQTSMAKMISRKPVIQSEYNNDYRMDIDSQRFPLIDLQSQALADFLLQQGWTYVSALISERDDDSIGAYESFRKLVESDGRICIGDVIRIKTGDRVELARNSNSPIPKIILAFTTASDTILALKTSSSYRNQANGKAIYVFLGESHDWEVQAKQQSGAHTWKSLAWGGVSIQPQKSVDDDFRKFLSNLNPKTYTESWFINFWEDYFKCSLKSGTTERGLVKKRCTGDEKLNLDIIGGRMTKQAYFMDSIKNFISALDILVKKSCHSDDRLCDIFSSDSYISNVTEIISQMGNQDQFAIYTFKPDVEQVNGGAYVQIGTWSTSDNLKLNSSWAWYDETRNANYSVPESTCHPPACHCRTPPISKKSHSPSSINTGGSHALLSEQRDVGTGNMQIKSSNPNVDTNEEDTAVVTPPTGPQWKKQLWTYIFLVINSILLIAAGLVFTVVSVKLCCGLIKGNQSLGICLLFGVMLLYSTAYFFIFDPCEMLCRLRYIAHSFSYSLCFGVMIAKAVQLRNSETLGFNGFISYWNYWLLLFFIVAVQMALNMQWAIVRQPVVVSTVEDAGTNSPTVRMHCSWTTGEFLASQAYVILLLCMALFMALLNRNVKRNYKETRWLLYTSLLCMATWVLWTVAYASAPDMFKDTVVVMELMICATVVLCFMFGPKLYILIRYESMLSLQSITPNVPKMQLGPNDMEKRKSIAPANEKDENAIGYFEMNDPNEDGRQSAGGDSVKSAITLCHTISTASDTLSISSVGVKKKHRVKKGTNEKGNGDTEKQ